MDASPQSCARTILDTTPAIIQSIRYEMRRERFHDLSVPQFRVLAYIARHPGCSLSDVAEYIGLTLPTMSVLINGLVNDSFVLRQTSLIDRRRVMLNLTEAGAAIHMRTLDGTLAWLTGILAPLSERDRQVVTQAMEILQPIFVTANAGAAAREAQSA